MFKRLRGFFKQASKDPNASGLAEVASLFATAALGTGSFATVFFISTGLEMLAMPMVAMSLGFLSLSLVSFAFVKRMLPSTYVSARRDAKFDEVSKLLKPKFADLYHCSLSALVTIESVIAGDGYDKDPMEMNAKVGKKLAASAEANAALEGMQWFKLAAERHSSITETMSSIQALNAGNYDFKTLEEELDELEKVGLEVNQQLKEVATSLLTSEIKSFKDASVNESEPLLALSTSIPLPLREKAQL